MNSNKPANQPPSVTPESQARLLAYTTAASLGAFFAGNTADAAPVLSQGLSGAGYPNTLIPGGAPAPYKNYFYFDVDGNGTRDFLFGVNANRIDVSGYGTVPKILNPSVNGYVVPWTAGMTVSGTTGTNPTYKRWLANAIGNPANAFNNFTTTGAVGLQFTSNVSGSPQTHYGYVNLKVNGGPGTYTVTVSDMYWESTPNTGIQVQAVPEPSSLALLAAGVAGLAVRRARRQA